MPATVRIGHREVGADAPVYVIAEIGINHNGELDVAKQLIDAAAACGCDAVKFQKRTPELVVSPDQRSVLRETPWGTMTYLDYRERLEFGEAEFEAINSHCRTAGIDWFASCWDVESVKFIEQFDPPCHKIASASITDADLLRAIAATGRTVIMSTGMSTMEEIHAATAQLPDDRLALAHTTSTYPCPNDELNLRMMATLRNTFDVPVGYSGHETGLQTTIAAVALGAAFIERHITLDRAMWGSDQAASVEPGGFARLVREVHIVQSALGDGVKRVYDSEIAVRRRLRGV